MFDVRCSNGDVVPAVEQADNGRIACPYMCESETHVHGIVSEGMTHRASHCRDKRPEDRGYFLLRPKRGGILDILHRWWIETSDPFRLNDGPGLLGAEGRAV